MSLLSVSTAMQAQGVGKQALQEFNPALRKVSSHLLLARKQVREGQALDAVVRRNPLLRNKGAQLEVEVKLNRLTPALLQQLTLAGMQVDRAHFEYAVVRGLIAPEMLGELSAIEAVRTVHPQYGYVLSNVGSVNNQADSTVRADQARSTFGIDGAGVTVGVLSDSFHDTILGGGSVAGTGCSQAMTGADPQVSGDLPDPLIILDNGGGGGTDEGAGMAELIADLAPGADIMFTTAFGGQANFAAGIANLVDCGADVIVDDVYYFAEPVFQDGFIAKAAQDAVDAGVAYFSSAGNQGTTGVHDVFTDASATNDQDFPPSGEDFHLFAGNNEYGAIVDVPGGCSVTFILQWAEPFDGIQGPGAVTDLDLYTCQSQQNPSSQCDALSVSSQGDCAGGAGGDPLEIGTYENPGGPDRTVYLAVDHFCGSSGADTEPGVEFRIITLESCGNSIAFEPEVFDKMQIAGHTAARGVTAVAAMFYGEADSGGNVFSPPGVLNVESFTSLGGDVPFYFADDGAPLPGAPELRFKPELTAPDGSNTSFFGNDIGFDADSHPNFFGTSAAAPHAAAAAALLLEASPDLNPAGITQVLQSSAVDVEDSGVDPLSGHGLIDALDAVQTVSGSGKGCVDRLELAAQTIGGNQYFRACERLTAGPAVTVSKHAALVLEVGQSGVIGLGPGFVVTRGGAFTASISDKF